MNNRQSGSLRFNRRKIVPVLVLVTLSGYILYRLRARRHSPDLDYPEDASREAQIRYLMQEHITHKGCQPVHSFVLHVENRPERILIREGIGVRGRSDTRIDADYQYNVASITKPIVATIILQLMEEGKLRLNDPARKYLSTLEYLRFEDLHILEGRKFADEIRIDHLLQHRTGLGDIFLDAATRFNLGVLLHPRRPYSPQRVMETFFAYKLNRSPHFRPGKGYYYSDINYVLLGLIVEQITNDSLPHQIRQRVLTPLAMHDTYFEFYEAERGHGKRLDCYLGPINMTKYINTSYEWAGGGLVSTTADMATFIKALFDLALFERKTKLDRMLDRSANAANRKNYARGLYHYPRGNTTYYGHGGFYGSLLMYNPEKEVVLSGHLAQATLPYKVDNLIDTVLEIVETR